MADVTQALNQPPRSARYVEDVLFGLMTRALSWHEKLGKFRKSWQGKIVYRLVQLVISICIGLTWARLADISENRLSFSFVALFIIGGTFSGGIRFFLWSLFWWSVSGTGLKLFLDVDLLSRSWWIDQASSWSEGQALPWWWIGVGVVLTLFWIAIGRVACKGMGIGIMKFFGIFTSSRIKAEIDQRELLEAKELERLRVTAEETAPVASREATDALRHLVFGGNGGASAPDPNGSPSSGDAQQPAPASSSISFEHLAGEISEEDAAKINDCVSAPIGPKEVFVPADTTDAHTLVSIPAGKPPVLKAAAKDAPAESGTAQLDKDRFEEIERTIRWYKSYLAEDKVEEFARMQCGPLLRWTDEDYLIAMTIDQGEAVVQISRDLKNTHQAASMEIAHADDFLSGITDERLPSAKSESEDIFDDDAGLSLDPKARMIDQLNAGLKSRIRKSAPVTVADPIPAPKDVFAPASLSSVIEEDAGASADADLAPSHISTEKSDISGFDLPDNTDEAHMSEDDSSKVITAMTTQGQQVDFINESDRPRTRSSWDPQCHSSELMRPEEVSLALFNDVMVIIDSVLEDIVMKERLQDIQNEFKVRIETVLNCDHAKMRESSSMHRAMRKFSLLKNQPETEMYEDVVAIVNRRAAMIEEVRKHPHLVANMEYMKEFQSYFHKIAGKVSQYSHSPEFMKLATLNIHQREQMAVLASKAKNEPLAQTPNLFGNVPADAVARTRQKALDRYAGAGVRKVSSPKDVPAEPFSVVVPVSPPAEEQVAVDTTIPQETVQPAEEHSTEQKEKDVALSDRLETVLAPEAVEDAEEDVSGDTSSSSATTSEGAGDSGASGASDEMHEEAADEALEKELLELQERLAKQQQLVEQRRQEKARREKEERERKEQERLAAEAAAAAEAERLAQLAKEEEERERKLREEALRVQAENEVRIFAELIGIGRPRSVFSSLPAAFGKEKFREQIREIVRLVEAQDILRDASLHMREAFVASWKAANKTEREPIPAEMVEFAPERNELDMAIITGQKCEEFLAVVKGDLGIAAEADRVETMAQVASEEEKKFIDTLFSRVSAARLAADTISEFEKIEAEKARKENERREEQIRALANHQAQELLGPQLERQKKQFEDQIAELKSQMMPIANQTESFVAKRHSFFVSNLKNKTMHENAFNIPVAVVSTQDEPAKIIILLPEEINDTTPFDFDGRSYSATQIIRILSHEAAIAFNLEDYELWVACESPLKSSSSLVFTCLNSAQMTTKFQGI